MLESVYVAGLIANLKTLTLWLSDLNAHTQQKLDVEDLLAGDKKSAIGKNDWKMSEEEQVVATPVKP